MNTITKTAPPIFQAAETQSVIDTDAGLKALRAGVQNFSPIGLEEMDAVMLLNRTDTKYVLSYQQLSNALNHLSKQYSILTINGIRVQHYRTLYFDTPDFEFYRRQCIGFHHIYKVRTREYLDTHLSFLEVKYKDQKERTDKTRMQTSQFLTGLDTSLDDFLRNCNPYQSQELEPKLWNTFSRITLVSKHNLERLTIDLDLNFHNQTRAFFLDGIAVAEVKQDGFSANSDFINQMRSQGIRPTGFSKYCFGASLLYDHLKHNLMKQKYLLVNKISEGAIKNGYVL